MKKFIWKTRKNKLKKSNLFKYSKFLKKNLNKNFLTKYQSMWNWSIKNNIEFWKSIWDFTGIKGEMGQNLFEKSEIFFKNKFFPEAKLNFAENLLYKNDNTEAVVFKSENGYRECISWKQLNINVIKFADWLIKKNVKKVIELLHIFLIL